MEMMTPNINEPRRVYYYKYAWLVVALILGILSYALFMFGLILVNSTSGAGPHLWDNSIRVIIIIGSFFLVDLIVPLCLGFLNLRVVTSAQGIAYYNIGNSIHSPWSNIAGRQSMQTGRGHTLSGLGLKQPAVQMDTWLSAAVKMMPFLSLMALLRGRIIRTPDMQTYAMVIPLDQIVPDWESGPLGDTVQRFAPQVFNAEAAAPAAEAETPTAPLPPLEVSGSQRTAAIWRAWLSPLVIIGLIIGEIILFLVLMRITRDEPPLWTARCDREINQIVVLPDNQVRAACASSIYTWRMSDGVLINKNSPEEAVGFLVYALSPDGQLLATTARDKTMGVWQTESGVRLLKLPLKKNEELTAAAFSADHQLLALGTSLGTVQLWRMGDNQPYAVLQEKPDDPSLSYGPKITTIAWSPTGQDFVDVQDNFAVRLHHASDGSLAQVVLKASEGLKLGSIDAAAFSTDGKTLAFGTLYGDIWLQSLTNAPLRSLYKGRSQESSDMITQLAYSPRGDLLLAVSRSAGKLQIFQISTGALMRTVWEKDVMAAAISPDEKWLVSGDSNFDDHFKVEAWPVIEPSR